MSENRFIEVEKKIAFQESMLEELRDAVDLQHKRIGLLEAELRLFKEKINDENPIRDIKDEEPPPHY